MAEARRPWFFRDLGVQDTPEGRLALLIVLLFPVLGRLQSEGTESRRVARCLTETFVTDIDDSLREMGVGDLAVPKKVKRAAQALLEQFAAYTRAAAAPEPVAALAADIAVAVPGLEGNPAGAEALARFALDAKAEFAEAPLDVVLAGRLAFPEPAGTLNN